MKTNTYEAFIRSGQHRLGEAAMAMEATGFHLDVDFCREQAEVARRDEQRDLLALRGHLDALGVQSDEPDAIWSSPKQMVELFHETLGAPHSPVGRKGPVRDGKISTDGAALEWIGREVPKLAALTAGVIQLRRTRGCVKYLEKLPRYVAKDGRVHPVLGAASDDDDRSGAITGRFGMKNPEGQQIPRNKRKDVYRIRRAFGAAPGKALVVVDYSALEVVLLAHYLVDMFNDRQLLGMVQPGAPDIHSVNARQVFGGQLGWERAGIPVASAPLEWFKNPDDPTAAQTALPEYKELRDLIKEVWYGLTYGKTAYGFGGSLLDANNRPIGEDRAEEIVRGLLDALPGLRMYQEGVAEYVLEHGGIHSLSGRWCDVSFLLDMGSNGARNRAIRRCLNFPMQAGGADVVGAAMVAVHFDEWLRSRGWRIVLQVHDELILEGPEDGAVEALARVRMLCEGVLSGVLMAPLQTSGGTGRNWEEAK